jgi:hypothetical protein
MRYMQNGWMDTNKETWQMSMSGPSIWNARERIARTYFHEVLSVLDPDPQAVKCSTDEEFVSSGMLRRVALVRTDVSGELFASFIRVTRIGELGTTLAVSSNRRTLRRGSGKALLSYKEVYFSKIDRHKKICVRISRVFLFSQRKFKNMPLLGHSSFHAVVTSLDTVHRTYWHSRKLAHNIQRHSAYGP